MLQRQTTHKDLHRAALGSVFLLAYLMAISPLYAENRPHTASATPQAQSGTAKLVKNEPARGGKLREIPLSTLNPEKANSQTAKSPGEKQETKNSKDAKVSRDPQDTKVDKDTKGKVANPSQTKSAKTTAAAKLKSATAATPRLNNGLVPPPPPIVPIGMDALGMYAQPVDYLSLKELEGRKKELTARFNELDSTVTDGERQIRERKERAELFESLYQEGVVSRKELETAKREAGEINRDLKFKQDELESVKISMKAVNNRLAVLKKMEEKMNAGKKKATPKSAKKK